MNVSLPHSINRDYPKYFFIAPNFELIDFAESHIEEAIKNGFYPTLYLDLNIVNDLENLTRYILTDFEKDKKCRKIIYLMRKYKLNFFLETAMVERFFNFDNLEFDSSSFSEFVKKFDDNLSYRFDSKRGLGSIDFFCSVKSIENFLQEYQNPLLLLYVGCLKIIEISRNGISRKTSIDNIKEFFNWQKDVISLSSAPLINLAISIFGGNQLVANLLKLNRQSDAKYIAKNACFDLFYYQVFLNMNWRNYEENNSWKIFVSGDKKLANICQTLKFMGRVESYTGKFNPIISSDYENCSFIRNEIDLIHEMSNQAFIPMSRLPEKRILIERVMNEKIRLEETLRN